MREFHGFPGRIKYTPIPNAFFSELLSQIDDIAELKVTLYIFWAIYRKRGYPRFVTRDELLADATLIIGSPASDPPTTALLRGIDLGIQRGTLLHLILEDEDTHDIYFVNTEADRLTVSRIRSGEVKLGRLIPREPAAPIPQQPNIFALYEQNIGMLSPLIAEEIKEAEHLYPSLWIEDAIKEAVDLNKHSWRYISRILERWAAEGKTDGKPGRHSKAESDPEEFYRRYGHLLKR